MAKRRAEITLFRCGDQEVRIPAMKNREELYLRVTKHRSEVVYWDSDEWQADPFLMLTILKAVQMVTEGIDVAWHLKELKNDAERKR